MIELYKFCCIATRLQQFATFSQRRYMEFGKLTGITQDTLYQWGAETSRPSSTASEIFKKLRCEREESLSNILISGKRNPVGLLGALNRHESSVIYVCHVR